MTPPKSPPQQAVSVEQADRDAAADYIRHHDYPRSEDIRKGRCDNHAAVVAFARHRLSAAMPADGVLRALQAQEDAEDAREACPDCEGEGQWEHCSICSLNFGRAIDLRRAALAGTSMAAFGASEAACYHYPGAHQQAERTAFCHGSEYASAAPKAPTAPIGEDGVSAPGADGLKSIGHDLAMAAGKKLFERNG